MVDNYEKTAITFGSISGLTLDEVTLFEWTPVALSGNYLVNQELLIRNRPIAGQPGFIQLVPFQLASGEVVIIERGWIPANSELAPATTMTPSDQPKALVARVRLSELTPNRDSPDGFATSIHLESLETTIGTALEQQFYLRLISELPGEASSPQPLSKPTLDEGNHLSYAVQWILFALMGFFALFWAIRQEQEYRRIEKIQLMSRAPSENESVRMATLKMNCWTQKANLEKLGRRIDLTSDLLFHQAESELFLGSMPEPHLRRGKLEQLHQ